MRHIHCSVEIFKKKSLFYDNFKFLDVANNEIICETASFILIESIRWLYLVPSFKDLNEYDQYLLIKQSWSIIFLLTSAEMKKFTDQSKCFFFFFFFVI